MRIPRVRSTIGRLMAAVLLTALILWAAFILRPSLIAVRQAEAAYRQAVLNREVAEFALKEYEEGVYRQEEATYLGQIALARSDRERAIDRLEWSTRMLARGKVSRATHVADDLAKQRADFDLEQAQTQLDVLRKYTRDKQIKALRSDIEEARAAEQAGLARYRLERSRRWRTLGF